ncbi:sentrin-specific protease 2-like protein [Colletotrichum tofieldiae]|nr:sentrin-specific protease 2-like protein [Colletotrichum tofieldiae]
MDAIVADIVRLTTTLDRADPRTVRAAWDDLAQRVINAPPHDQTIGSIALLRFQGNSLDRLLGLAAHIYQQDFDKIPGPQQRSLQKASEQWGISVWHFYLTFGPEVAKSCHSCRTLKRLSRLCETKPSAAFSDFVFHAHAQRQARIAIRSRSANLRTFARMRPSDIEDAASTFAPDANDSARAAGTKTISAVVSPGVVVVAAAAANARHGIFKSPVAIDKATVPDIRRPEAAAHKADESSGGFAVPIAEMCPEPKHSFPLDGAVIPGPSQQNPAGPGSPLTADRSDDDDIMVIDAGDTTLVEEVSVQPRWPNSPNIIRDTSDPKRKRQPEVDTGNGVGHKKQKTIHIPPGQASSVLSVPFNDLFYGLQSLDGRSWVNDVAMMRILRRLNSDNILVVDSFQMNCTSPRRLKYLAGLGKEKNCILFPLLINGNHWVLYNWDRHARVIGYLDPFGRLPRDPDMNKIKSWVQRLVALDRPPDVVPGMGINQTNQFDCGVITMANAFNLATRSLVFPSTTLLTAKARVYFSRLLLTSSDSTPLGLLHQVQHRSPLEIAKQLRHDMLALSASKLPEYLRAILRRDLFIKAHQSTRVVQLQERHCALRRLLVEAHLSAMDAIRLEKLVKDRVCRLKAAVATMDATPSSREPSALVGTNAPASLS